jgi:hypothetical protein
MPSSNNSYRSKIQAFKLSKGKQKKVDFLSSQCRTTKNWSLFWIGDSQEKVKQTEPAFITLNENVEGCVAEVDNSASLTFDFYAIDACLILRKRNSEKISLCDAMIVTNNSIVFIELKDRNDKKEVKGIEQIETTIDHFLKAHPDFSSNMKRGYFCNKKHPNFGTSKSGKVEEIIEKYGFRLCFKTKIILN